ncbi:hypothetical protein CK203_053030 [Vitis vinifera]|uniref:Uncharacterized protein n=1 Tax=Vitis vinifera TaxID=29760 RepID=A0A438FL77_VITVI|nr:hypothetical protein CK203_053030 [Vitis vinifera]
MKFIHDGRVIMVRSSHDTAISFKAILEISHNDEDLFLIGFTFDESCDKDDTEYELLARFGVSSLAPSLPLSLIEAPTF